jgi:hypothetical protein
VTVSRVWALSPRYSTAKFPNFPHDATLEDKINIFEDRILGWQIGIAKEILQRGIPHSDLALLQIVVCYFEMLGIYRSGYLGDRQSPSNFKTGFRATFPEIPEADEAYLDNFYDKVRSGVYHVGQPKAGVILSCERDTSIGFLSGTRILVICAKILVEDIEIKFRQYMAELRNFANVELRRNFEARFDYDHSPQRL